MEEITLTGKEYLSFIHGNIVVMDIYDKFRIEITPEFMESLKELIREQENKIDKFKI